MTGPWQGATYIKGKEMRICSGIQPSGRIHLGNYFGAIHNWLMLQKKEQNTCFFFIADLHAHTMPTSGKTLSANTLELAATLFATGIDPQKSTLFVQSAVPAHTQLAWLFNCLAPFGEMERMVQFKEKSEQNPNAINVGLFSYPILQAADILAYRADMVPVGIDQAQHLELTRTLARKFNNRFCSDDAPLFVEPQTLHTKTLKILGLDGKRKMSKSYNNYIALTATEEELWQTLRTGATDPARVRRDDPGDPNVCNIFSFHKMFSPPEDQDAMATGCRAASIGCMDCKKTLHRNLNIFIAPIRERYQELMARPDEVRDMLAAGAAQANEVANETLAQVYELVGCALK